MVEFNVSCSKSDRLECHVLASGWSLNDTYSLIERKNAFILGFNFSFLKCPDPDVHFIENASLVDERFFINSMQHYAGLERYGVFKSAQVVFKNISEFKNSSKLIGLMYSKRAKYVRDKHFRLFSKGAVRPGLKLMMQEQNSIPQALSSVISLVFFARIMGFKKIVIHGLDFYGPHFYGTDLSRAVYEGIDHVCNLAAVEKIPHKTYVGESGVGVRDVLVELKVLLAEEGIQLVSASKKSPSAEILGSLYD